jgi:hypothetical protein
VFAMTELKRYPIERMRIKVKDLYDMFKSGKLILNPEYQRSYIWKKMPGKRERLIDSLLREFDIGTIFLRRIEKIVQGNPEISYECLDGQQRLKSIFDFIDGEYATDPQISKEFDKPMLFDDLDQLYRVRLTEMWMEPVIVKSNDEDIISEIFMRLQEGVPLRAPEKLNAIKGEMKKAVVRLSEHTFLDKTGISKFRFAHRYLCAQFMFIEINQFIDTLQFKDMRYKELKKMYEDYADSGKLKEITRCENNVKSTLNFLNDILGDAAAIIKYRGDALSIYLLASYLRAKYAINTKRHELRNFIIKFLEQVENAQSSPYKDFKINRRRATTQGEYIKENFEIILREFLKYAPDLELKDDKRLFDYGQKLAIYNNQSGKCKACGKPVNIKEAHFHHKVPWDKGGKTTVENGEMYHPEHHPR